MRLCCQQKTLICKHQRPNQPGLDHSEYKLSTTGLTTTHWTSQVIQSSSYCITTSTYQYSNPTTEMTPPSSPTEKQRNYHQYKMTGTWWIRSWSSDVCSSDLPPSICHLVLVVVFLLLCWGTLMDHFCGMV